MHRGFVHRLGKLSVCVAWTGHEVTRFVFSLCRFSSVFFFRSDSSLLVRRTLFNNKWFHLRVVQIGVFMVYAFVIIDSLSQFSLLVNL